MHKAQKGFGMILLIIGLAIFALMLVLYVRGSGTGPSQKSQLEVGQEGINQAREINNAGKTQSQEIQKELE
jgi:hypothetical protein